MLRWTDGTAYLMHHGIKGQKWGVRRYQNADRTLTPEGRARYKAIGKTNLRRAKTAATVSGASAAAVGAAGLAKGTKVAINTKRVLDLIGYQAFGSAISPVSVGKAVAKPFLKYAAAAAFPAGAVAAGSLAVAAYAGYRLLSNKYREDTSYDREYNRQLDAEYAKEYY